MNIVLIGYRACGKSTVGTIVARRLCWYFFDIDRAIEARAGANIAEAYRTLGELRYRNLESQVVADACKGDRQVIAMGGGSIVRPENQGHAMRDSLVVYLKLTADELWRRMLSDPQSQTTRPNLAGGGLAEVVEMLARREPIYQRCATLHLDASRPPLQLADEILAHIHLEREPR